ncbi:MAG: hypothetical protein ACREOS_13175 [Candidatus Dormibacteraceae bacterium]
MAEALLRAQGGAGVRVLSAGSRPAGVKRPHCSSAHGSGHRLLRSCFEALVRAAAARVRPSHHPVRHRSGGAARASGGAGKLALEHPGSGGDFWLASEAAGCIPRNGRPDRPSRARLGG